MSLKDKWIQIFKTGTHTDNAGNIKTWTESDLDSIVKQYNEGTYEAPVVIGHPVTNAPAYGWVEKLKRQGEFLLGKFKDVIPEFEEAVQQGLYKKRSISMYPDLTLRHVGFLGAAPPSVKGLENIKFAEKENTVIEFSALELESNLSFVGRFLQGLNEYLYNNYEMSDLTGMRDRTEPYGGFAPTPGKRATPINTNKSKSIWKDITIFFN